MIIDPTVVKSVTHNNVPLFQDSSWNWWKCSINDVVVYHVQRDPENLTNSVVANYYPSTRFFLYFPETYAWVLDLAAYTADGADPQIPDD